MRPVEHPAGGYGGPERRTEPRVPANRPARLFHGADFNRWIDCVVKDRSPSGAKIQVPAIFDLPPMLLLLEYSLGTAHFAQRRWRRGDLAGLGLEAPLDLASLPDHLDAVRQAWTTLGPGLGAGSTPGGTR